MRELKNNIFFLQLGQASNRFYLDLLKAFKEVGIVLVKINEFEFRRLDNNQKEVVLAIISSLEEFRLINKIKQKMMSSRILLVEANSYKTLRYRFSVMQRANFIELPISIDSLVNKVLLRYLQHTISPHILSML